MSKRSRVYNTFDAHRLLHWAELEGHQLALKRALFAAYFTEGRDPSDREALIGVATHAGLDPFVRARFSNRVAMPKRCASASASTASAHPGGAVSHHQ